VVPHARSAPVAAPERLKSRHDLRAAQVLEWCKALSQIRIASSNRGRIGVMQAAASLIASGN
jgi:hypothetical protein